MAMYDLMETQIPELYTRALYDEKGFDLAANLTDEIAIIYFNGTSYLLRDAKNKEHPVAFLYESIDGNLYAAAIVRFVPSEDESMPGHWSYVWTFDKSDIPDNARIIRISDVEPHSYFRTQAGQFYFGFVSDEAVCDLGNCLFKEISHWLQDNALSDEEVGVKLDGVFKARCAIEDNEVVKSIELIGETKAIIKDDQAIEV